MKRPVAQMSLFTDPKLAELVTPENYMLHPEWVAYIDNKGREPKNFEEGTEAYLQWTYTGRKKIDKETLKRSYQEV